MQPKDRITGLTAQREVFCQEIAKGKTQTEAYLIAYPISKNWLKDTVSNNAYKLMNTNEVITRISVLKSQITDKIVKSFTKSKTDILKKLEKLIEEAETSDVESFKKSEKMKEIRECLKEQAKLLGYYEEQNKPQLVLPENTEITIKVINNKEPKLVN